MLNSLHQLVGCFDLQLDIQFIFSVTFNVSSLENNIFACVWLCMCVFEHSFGNVEIDAVGLERFNFGYFFPLPSDFNIFKKKYFDM